MKTTIFAFITALFISSGCHSNHMVVRDRFCHIPRIKIHSWSYKCDDNSCVISRDDIASAQRNFTNMRAWIAEVQDKCVQSDDFMTSN